MRAELIIFLFAVLLLQATAQNITCCGIDSTNNTVCSGNGQCVSNDSCVCSNNFTGSCCQECSTGFVLSSDLKRCEPSCFFVGSSNSSVCTGNGICVAVVSNAQSFDIFRILANVKMDFLDLDANVVLALATQVALVFLFAVQS